MVKHDRSPPVSLLDECRNASGSPWRADGLDVAFERSEIAFDGLAEIAENGHEEIGGDVVLLFLRTGRRAGHGPAAVDDRLHAADERRRGRLAALLHTEQPKRQNGSNHLAYARYLW